VERDSSGVAQALGAYVLWGLLPLYWRALRGVPALEILAHRIVWSLVFLVGVVWLGGRLLAVWSELGRGGALRLHGMAAGLLAVNWLTYIHGVNTDRIVETSLGYYINPLVSVVLGVMVLRERLSRVQWLAVGLAAAGVIQLTLRAGRLPWIAIVLASTFAVYGLAKKQTRASPVPGLVVETGVLLVPALVFLGIGWGRGAGAMGHAAFGIQALLVMGGVVTVAPLWLFARAAQTVRLSTMGVLQYVAPTCGLVIGTMVYGEPFDAPRRWAFGMIWAGLVLYGWESRRGRLLVAG
jgi:chloramphenicol-sensitive protein RarD